MSETTQRTTWWGDYRIDVASHLFWQIDTLRMLVKRQPREWHVVYEQNGAEELADSFWQLDTKPERTEDWDEQQVKRFVFTETEERIALVPKLADRPVVVKPRNAFYIPPRQKVILYVSSPVWISIAVHEAAVALCEFPIARPSDTWFGPSTMEGELCYDSKTHARLNLNEVIFRPHRAVTPVEIENHASDSLFLERISLPVAYLPLYGNAQGHLWTPSISMVREEDAQMAELTIGKSVAAAAGEVELLSHARKEASRSRLLRTMSALFG